MKENVYSVRFDDYLPLVGKSVVKSGVLLNCSTLEDFHGRVVLPYLKKKMIISCQDPYLLTFIFVSKT